MSLKTAHTEVDIHDRRRPIAWDWLLCFISPYCVIAYHHRRAGFSLSLVFFVVLAAFVSGMVGMALSLAWLGHYMAEFVAASKVETFWDAFERLPSEERARLIADYIKSTPKVTVMSNLNAMNQSFLTAVVAFAIYVVYKAKSATKTARRELLECYQVTGATAAPTASAHPVLSSPKGTGSAFMSYALALMYPPVSYAINSDRRLVNYGVALLYAILQVLAYGALLCFVAVRSLPNVASEEMVSLMSWRLGVMMAVSFVAILLLPVRMALVNLASARKRYATVIIQ